MLQKDILRHFKKINKESISSLPNTIGVYIFMHHHTPLYIGKSVNLKARLRSHLYTSRTSSKEAYLFHQTTNFLYTPTDNNFKALLLEAKLIKHFQPHFNVQAKDDKSPLYIKITIQQTYPKVLLVRKENDGQSLYFGPFPSKKIATNIIRAVRQLVPFCTNTHLSSRSCFYSKIGLCNPCPNYINSLPDNHRKRLLQHRYHQQINQLITILEGNYQPIIDNLRQQMTTYAQQLNYEQALSLRNRLHTFQKFLSQDFHHQPFITTQDRLDSLFQLLAPYFPQLHSLHRIEGYDASTLFLQNNTVSLVTFIHGLPDKSQYKRFHIPSQPNLVDAQILTQALNKRLSHSNWPLPNLFLIDGGRPQIQAVADLFHRHHLSIPFLGLAKHPDRLVLPNLTTLTPSPTNPGLHLLQAIRDEAHRFARQYHLFLRNQHLSL